MKKRIVYTVWILTGVALFVMFLWVSNLLVKTLLSLGAKLMLCLPVLLYVIRKCFYEISPRRMPKVLYLCAVSLLIQFVLEAFRFYLSGGDAYVLFVPIAIPLCFLAVIHALLAEKGRDRGEKVGAWAVGLLLLAVSVSFEIAAFMDICM